nr:MAG TPA: tail fiber protein [Caudoviricetes sp.]
MPGKQVTELDALPSFTDNSLLPVHNGAGLKKGLLSQLADYLGKKFSNPNLLINPDFKINQRGATSYEKQGYSVDRWKIWNVTVTSNANGGITVKNDKYTDTGTFLQYLENATEGDSTLSCYVTSVSGTVTMVADDNSQVVLKQGLNVVHTSKSTKAFTIFLNRGTNITLKWVKLEQGKVATEFIAPNYAEEILKCQRFYAVLESSLAGYGANNAIYIPFARGVYMRNSRNVIFTGANKQTFLRVNGTGKQISFNTTNGYANNQYVRVYTNPVDTSLNNTAIGIDLNDVTISVDAEIY